METASMYLSVVFLFLSLASSSFPELNTVKVKAGDDVTLQCQAPKHAVVTLLEWTRPDLAADGYVFFYRDNHLYENYQHPSFVGRVELREPGMKDGDVSVILSNVSNYDTGTYQCEISVSKTSRSKRAAADFSKTIQLLVEDSGDAAGNIWDGGNVCAALTLSFMCVIVVGVWVGIFLKYKRPNSSFSS